MTEKSCFFIGHRDAAQEIYPKLEKEIENLILNFNVTKFVVGAYGNFDNMVSAALEKIKDKYYFIRVYLLLPYYTPHKHSEVPKGFDGSVFPEGLENTFPKIAIVKANRYMVEHSDYLIAHAHFVGSNSVKLVDYAKKLEAKGKLVVKII